MSFRQNILAGLVVGIGLLAAAPAAAQTSPFSLEARTGATIPTGDLSDAGVESGLLFAVDVYYTFAPTFSLYGGWAYHGFSNDVSVTGPRAGLKVLFPMAGDATPWVRGGATYNQLDGLGGTSDSNLGVELGAGIDYALSPRLSITPAARYESFSPDLDASGTVSFLTLDLGIHLHF